MQYIQGGKIMPNPQSFGAPVLVHPRTLNEKGMLDMTLPSFLVASDNSTQLETPIDIDEQAIQQAYACAAVQTKYLP